jgi:3-hydroxymyristoyl/3-hydroxydecanoyl-(acyl carrier protein) dehydratase
MRFVMVDRILSMVPGKSIEAIKVMPPSEELFQDHFPGFPVVPGVLLTEMMAQASGKCLYAEVNSSKQDYATVKCHAEVDDKKICSAELLFSFIKKDKFSGTEIPEIFALNGQNHDE